MKYIATFFTLSFLFLVPFVSDGQIVITGNVYDNDSVALEYATIRVYRNDTLINGTTTDKFGFFSCQVIDTVQYKVKISFIGFETYQLFTFKPESSKVEVGNVYLKYHFIEPCYFHYYYYEGLFGAESTIYLFTPKQTPHLIQPNDIRYNLQSLSSEFHP
jgi:hypothetical protein